MVCFGDTPSKIATIEEAAMGTETESPGLTQRQGACRIELPYIH